MNPVTAPARTTADFRLGLSTLDSETRIDSLPVEGRMPEWLTGSLLRTGPAKFDLGGRRVNHWFDGLAMLHRFAFAEGAVSYANRFLRSRAYTEAERTGGLAFREFATDPCRSLFKRVTSVFSPGFSDNGVVNLSRVGDEFIAMTETPLPVVFDPRTLEAAGVAYEPPGQLSTAHPHLDPDRGEMVNYAAHLGPRSEYRFYAQKARDQQRRIASIAVREPAYVHSFGMSERHLVLAEIPFTVNPMRLALGGRPYIENYEWKPERGTRLRVVDRGTGELVGTYEADPFFTFHHVNAYEDGSTLVVDLVAYDDPGIIDFFYLDSLESSQRAAPHYEVRRFRLGLESGRVEQETLSAQPLELPRINYAMTNGRRHRYVYGVGTGEGSEWLDRIVKLDADDGETRVWLQEGCYPGEPVFVADPAGGGEDAGVLLSVTLDATAGTSFLLVLDARDLSELARAAVPHHIPFGFHGNHYGSL